LPDVSALLRLDEIAIKNKSYNNKVLPELRQQNVRLTRKVLDSMANTIKFLGIDHTSPAFVSGVVADIISGIK
jgi:hypothetical protein